MNSVQRDKCYVRRMVRAGCVEAVGIAHARRWDSMRTLSNAERVSAWRRRANQPGLGNAFRFQREEDVSR